MKDYDLHGIKKIEYILDYYKLPIVLSIVIIYIFCSLSYKLITKKNTLLSVAAINIEISNENIPKFSDDYLLNRNFSSKKYNINFYNNLISEGNPNDGASYEYAYASSMKLLALMTDKTLDIVLMDEKAYQTFSNNKYLYNLYDLKLSENTTNKQDAILISSPYFSDEIYIGIIQNSRHLEEAVQYINYLINVL